MELALFLQPVVRTMTPSKPALGSVHAVYRDRPLRWRDLFLLFLPGTSVVISTLFYGLWHGFDAYTHYGPTAATTWSQPWFFLSLLALLSLLLLALIRIRRSRCFVAVHEKGLKISLSPGKPRILLWVDIAGVTTGANQERFFRVHSSPRYNVTIFPNLSAPIRIPHRIKNLPVLAQQIKSLLYPRLLPGLKADLSADRWLHFGPIRINQQVIAFSKSGAFSLALKGKQTNQEVPWTQVSRLQVEGGHLVIELDHQTATRLPVVKIPNLELLLHLIEHEINP